MWGESGGFKEEAPLRWWKERTRPLAFDALDIHQIIWRTQVSHEFGIYPAVADEQELRFTHALRFKPIPSGTVRRGLIPRRNKVAEITLQVGLHLFRVMLPQY